MVQEWQWCETVLIPFKLSLDFFDIFHWILRKCPFRSRPSGFIPFASSRSHRTTVSAVFSRRPPICHRIIADILGYTSMFLGYSGLSRSSIISDPETDDNSNAWCCWMISFCCIACGWKSIIVLMSPIRPFSLLCSSLVMLTYLYQDFMLSTHFQRHEDHKIIKRVQRPSPKERAENSVNSEPRHKRSRKNRWGIRCTSSHDRSAVYSMDGAEPTVDAPTYTRVTEREAAGMCYLAGQGKWTSIPWWVQSESGKTSLWLIGNNCPHWMNQKRRWSE
jgi:hypothetical protein